MKTYLTVQGKEITNLVREGRAKGTFRCAAVVQCIKTGVYGLKAYSGDALVSLTQIGIVWMPNKSREAVFSSCKKFAWGYYTPMVLDKA